MMGQYERAAKIFKTISDKYPDDFRAYYNRGSCLYHLGRNEEAIDIMKSAIGLDNCPVDVYGSIANILLSLRRHEEAVAWCQKGLQRSPNDMVCLSNLNVGLRVGGHIEQAIDLSWRAMGLDRFQYPRQCTLGLAKRGASEPNITASDVEDKHTSESEVVQVIVVKWGDKYSPEYVNNLYRMLKEKGFPHGRFSLTCFTDDATGVVDLVQCRILPDDSPWTTWWTKAHIFNPSLFDTDVRGPRLYIDLEKHFDRDRHCKNSKQFFKQLTIQLNHGRYA